MFSVLVSVYLFVKLLLLVPGGGDVLVSVFRLSCCPLSDLFIFYNKDILSPTLNLGLDGAGGVDCAMPGT